MSSIADSQRACLHKLTRFDYFVFYFCLIDNLFLPYFWVLSVPLSMPVVIVWALLNLRLVFLGLDGKLIAGLIFTIVLGGLIGSFAYPDYLYDNIKFSFYYYYVFSSYALFLYCLKNGARGVDKVFFVFLAFVFAFVVVYFFNKDFYGYLVKIWNFKSGGALINKYEYLEGYRFSFIWTDPNNIAYMFCAFVFFVFAHRRLSFFQSLLIIVAFCCVLLASMSRGGVLAAVVTTVIYFAFALFRARESRGIFVHKSTLYVVPIMLVVGIFLVLNDVDLVGKAAGNSTVIEAIDRFGETDDTRVDKWGKIYQDIYYFDIIFHIFSGYGAGTIINGESSAPHNGHIFWVINYGFFSYVMLLLLMFRKRFGVSYFRSIWFIPVFLGFSLNVMVGEAKIFVILMLLLAVSVSCPTGFSRRA